MWQLETGMGLSLLSQNVIIVIGCPQLWWVPCVYVCVSVCVSEHMWFHWEFYFFFFLKNGILIISNSDEDQ